MQLLLVSRGDSDGTKKLRTGGRKPGSANEAAGFKSMCIVVQEIEQAVIKILGKKWRQSGFHVASRGSQG